MRLVLDTNTVISALLWRGTPHQLLQAIRQHPNLQLYSSAALFEELAGVLTRASLRKQLAAIDRQAGDVLLDYGAAVQIDAGDGAGAGQPLKDGDPKERMAEVVTNCDHLQKLKFSKSLPFAFTEYGAVALANVLASSQAVEMGINVVRAFVRLRQAASLHEDLPKRLAEIEEKTERLELSHDTFSRNTRNQLRRVFEAIRALAIPPEPPKRPIGFVSPEEKKKPLKSKAVRAR